MNKIPTAEEFLNNSNNINYRELGPSNPHLDILPFIEADLIEFAKLHVEAALKEASEKAETIHDGSVVAELCNMSGNPKLKDITLNALIWRPSILNAYPLTNIK